MSETRHVRTSLGAVYKGPAWHGPSLTENLTGITAEMAAKHPIAGAHSIWEILAHVSTWEHYVASVLTEGKQYATMQGEDDWPPVKDTSEAAWKTALDHAESGHHALRAAMKAFPEADLEKIVPGRDFPYFVLLHGMV